MSTTQQEIRGVASTEHKSAQASEANDQFPGFASGGLGREARSLDFDNAGRPAGSNSCFGNQTVRLPALAQSDVIRGPVRHRVQLLRIW